jgi:hypothetical protein
VSFAIGGPTATASEYLPTVAWNETRTQYLIVWSDGRNGATRGHDIYGQRVSASGERLRGNLLISGPGATEEESQPSVAWNAAANEHLVVWEDRRNQHTSGIDIYGQRLSAAGERLGDDFRISGALATSNERDAAVVWNSQANEYLWCGPTSATTPPGAWTSTANGWRAAAAGWGATSASAGPTR